MSSSVCLFLAYVCLFLCLLSWRSVHTSFVKTDDSLIEFHAFHHVRGFLSLYTSEIQDHLFPISSMCVFACMRCAELLHSFIEPNVCFHHQLRRFTQCSSSFVFVILCWLSSSFALTFSFILSAATQTKTFSKF